MMVFSFWFPLFMYFSGLLVFCFKCKHLLLMLLSLEFVVISMYFFLLFCLSGFSCEYYFSMVFLTLSVCEGALGLSILVSLIRFFGNDYFQSFSVLW